MFPFSPLPKHGQSKMPWKVAPWGRRRPACGTIFQRGENGEEETRRDFFEQSSCFLSRLAPPPPASHPLSSRRARLEAAPPEGGVSASGGAASCRAAVPACGTAGGTPAPPAFKTMKRRSVGAVCEIAWPHSYPVRGCLLVAPDWPQSGLSGVFADEKHVPRRGSWFAATGSAMGHTILQTAPVHCTA